MKFIVFIAITLLFVFVPYLRVVASNFFEFLFLSLKDFFFYLRRLSFNQCPCGYINAYCGLFGQGKTLSAVHYIRSLYNRYDGKKVFYNGKFRRNKIIILSNVDFLLIPYFKLESLRQIVEYCQNLKTFESDKYCVTFLVLIDEASSQLNSRDFKSNIEPMLLNTLLTSRHYRMSIFYTSQRFLLVDKLLREVTSTVVECRKIGRVQLQTAYNAYDLENSSNLLLVKPRSRSGYLVRDIDYKSYDTLACVDNLNKSMMSGKMLSTEEILQSIIQEDNLDSVSLSAFGKRRFKRGKRTRR